jgi:hypothetical protein
MKQPKMKIIATWEVYPVISLDRIDWWTTLRAFPNMTFNWSPTNYVIVKGDWEETEVGAELIFEE